MNYTKIYSNIINKARQRYNITEYENHHIIPKCIGGTDHPENIVKLTYREHFLCHWLLVNIYKNDNNVYKLASAFNKMCAYSDTNLYRSLSSRKHAIARKLFSKYHPARKEEVKHKISSTLKEYYKNKTPSSKLIRIPRLCACGCGVLFEPKTEKQRYIQNHSQNNTSRETKEKQSISLKTYLNNLTEEENKSRLEKSLGKTDHIKRGQNISKSKKGKKTNQQEIMGKKYAAMNDEEFNEFISSKSNYVIKRMINLREKYRQ